MLYFTFKGIDSRDYFMVNKLPPITKAAADVEKIEVAGRDGYLTNNLGSYRSMLKPCECTLLNLDNLDFVTSWLDGSGEVIFSNEPNKKYRANIINQIDFDKISLRFHSFIIIFDSQPFKYSTDANIILSSPGQILNKGTKEAYPTIKVNGTGNVTLSVNGKTVQLELIQPHLILDCELQECYRSDVRFDYKMTGDFPILKVGENQISWTGSVTSLEITPNHRFL